MKLELDSFRRFFSILFFIVVALLGVSSFHRTEIFSAFELVPGDLGDARFVAYIVDLWSQAVQNGFKFPSHSFFYPEVGTLGYSDALFSYGLIAIPLKLLGGYDSFTVLQLVLIVCSILNFGTMFAFLRFTLKFGMLASLSGAFIFSFNSPKVNQVAHLQLHAMWTVPLMAALLVRFCKKTGSGFLPQLVPLAIFSILLNLQLLTAFYYGWFFIFWLGILALCACVFPSSRSYLVGILFESKRPILWSLVIFILGLVPFLYLYLPVYKQMGGRGYGEVVSMVPSLLSWFWMNSENYFWGWISRLNSYFSSIPYASEHAIGFGIGLTIFIFSTWVFVIGQHIKAVKKGATSSLWGIENQLYKDLFKAIALSVLATVIVSLKVSGDKSLWYFVFKYIPGAGSIRAVSRFALFLAFPLSIIFALFVHHFWNKKDYVWLNGYIVKFALVCFLIIVIAEQQHRSIPTFNKKGEIQRISMMTEKGLPEDCKSFYVEPSQTVFHPVWILHIDAMYLANQLKRPTINGYSGLSPKGWDLWEIRSPNYGQAVEKWTELKNIEPRPCRFEIDR